MKIVRLFLCVAAVGLLMQSPSASQAETKKARVLMITQSAGYRHGSVNRGKEELAPAEIAMTQLGQQTGLFDVHCSQDCKADFTKDNLKNYDLVMFYTTGKLPIADADMSYFLNDWLKQKGHGFIGFHSATDTFKEFEPYWDVIGGTFNGHPWGSGTTVTVSVHEPDHPTMKAFGGAEFTIKDEIYQYKNWQPEKVRVLMSLNMAKCNPAKPYMVPVAWVKTIGEGRMFYTNLGHNEGTWVDKRFLGSVEAGVKWTLGHVDGESKPNPELSAELEKKAKADTDK